jgi:hypothetical protein
VLSVHHATPITLQSTPSVKIIENDLGRSFVVQQQVAQTQIPMMLPQGMPLPAAQPVAPAGSPT